MGHRGHVDDIPPRNGIRDADPLWDVQHIPCLRGTQDVRDVRDVREEQRQGNGYIIDYDLPDTSVVVNFK
jgi:hypothetical protein